MKSKLTILSIALFLITTISLVMLNIYYHEPRKYIGHINIESQEQYHAFLDAIFVAGVSVNVLDLQTYPYIGKDIPTYREGLWVDYPELPIAIGFDLGSTKNPVANLVGVNMYQNGDETQYVPYVAIFMVGYGLAAGAWISRKGIYQEQKVERCANVFRS